jgi:hypothetical protein
MTSEQIEKRLETVERSVLLLSQRVDSLFGVDPKSTWWERVPPLTDGQKVEWDEMQKYCLYVRQTGQDPPPDWRPGDPIPEPDHWK